MVLLGSLVICISLSKFKSHIIRAHVSGGNGNVGSLLGPCPVPGPDSSPSKFPVDGNPPELDAPAGHGCGNGELDGTSFNLAAVLFSLLLALQCEVVNGVCLLKLGWCHLVKVDGGF